MTDTSNPTHLEPGKSATAGADDSVLLELHELNTWFYTRAGVVKAVNDVSLEVRKGETVALVGESGCGKSTVALSILRLVPKPGRIVSGQVLFQGRDVTEMSATETREYRGKDVAMVFQNPAVALDPVMRIGSQIQECMTTHRRLGRKDARARATQLLEQVGIGNADQRANDYPHQFSGGMQQRVVIAMALANEPSLVIADEPTTALDVTIQAQIIELLRDMNRRLGTAIVLITHNLALVASLCTRVVVMYAGRIVETGSTRDIFKNPRHPYTWSLLRSVPSLESTSNGRLISIGGSPPDLLDPPSGCLFHPRCPFRIDRCVSEEPPLVETAGERSLRCWVPMGTSASET